MRHRLLNFLKAHTWIIKFVSFGYNTILSPSLLRYYIIGGVSIKGAFLKNVKIDVSNGAKIYIGARAKLNNCTLTADGIDSIIRIDGASTNIKNSSFESNKPNGRIYIQNGFTSEGCYVKAHENRTVKIGEDCMFSAGITLTTTDFHSILSMESGRRINKAKDIVIGNHVWLGRNVNVLKGSVIDDGIVVGMESIVTGHLDSGNSIYVGSPAKCIKKDIEWVRKLL